MGLLYGRAGRLTAENGGFRPTQGLSTGRCSGEWSPNVTIHDQLRVVRV
jgi:hypothetical protein